MLRHLFTGLLLLTYLFGGLAPTLWLQETRNRTADAPPLPYEHSAKWHDQYHADLDCWDRCNGDQGRAAFAAAHVKSRPVAPVPRFNPIDVHMPALLPAIPAALPPTYGVLPAPAWKVAVACAGLLDRTVPPPESQPTA